jgi:hypothetical protein
MPLLESFWDIDHTPLLDEHVLGHLFTEVILFRPDRNKWPDFWGAEEVWDVPDLREIRVIFQGLDRWGQVSSNHLIEVTASYFGHGQHKVEGCWSPFTRGNDDVVYPLGLNTNALCCATDTTEADLVWMFRHWRPQSERRGTLADWWSLAQKRLPERGLAPHHFDMVRGAVEKALRLRGNLEQAA